MTQSSGRFDGTKLPARRSGSASSNRCPRRTCTAQ
jgi:hypothetical protein